jgi:YggT family protein
MILWGLFFIFLAFMLLRLVFNYADPNPFGAVGRFGFKVRKLTEKWVYPSARFLSSFRVDIRLAPIVTLLIGLVITFFASSIFWNLFFIIDGLSGSVVAGDVKKFIGYTLFAILGILILFIFIRFIAQWFVFTRKTLLGFVMRVTDPILLPVQKLIPPIGMFDISAMVVLLLIGLLQTLVLNMFVR